MAEYIYRMYVASGCNEAGWIVCIRRMYIAKENLLEEEDGDVHAGMYFAMEKAGAAHDKKIILFFCISEAKRLGYVNRKKGKGIGA